MANMHRGEVGIDIDGIQYVLRPSFDILVRLETRIGTGIIALARKFHESKFTVSDVAAVLFVGLSGYTGNPPVTYEKIGESIVAEGIAKFLPVVTVFLTYALGGTNE